MNAKRSNLMIICIGLVVVCVSISACNRGRTTHPASPLQRALAARLANPDVCPTGNSQDVQ